MTALKLFALFFLLAAFETSFIYAYRYKLYRKPAKWTDAKTTCQAEGALLFHPDNVQELVNVLNELDVGTNNGNNFWIGVSDLDKQGAYETLDGRPISQVFNKWNQGHPYSNSNKHCVGLDLATNSLFVDDCRYVASYICKNQNAVIEDFIIANISGKIIALEQQLANQTATLEALKLEAEAMKVQAASQATALERLTAN